MRRILSFVSIALLSLVSQGAAQVGHDPRSSPYRDLRYGQFLTVTAGKAFGSGGTLGIGPHQGTVIWARHDFLADRPLSLGLGGGLAKLDRNYADLQATSNRVRGPVEHDVYFAEGSISLNLTGTKTWHALAPYIGTGIGLAFAGRLPEDQSGYKFGTKFFLAPNAGVRVFVTRRLFVRLEAKAVFWNINHGEAYRSTDPDGLGPLEPLLFNQPIKEWTPVPMLHAGLGYAFRRPF